MIDLFETIRQIYQLTVPIEVDGEINLVFPLIILRLTCLKAKAIVSFFRSYQPPKYHGI